MQLLELETGTPHPSRGQGLQGGEGKGGEVKGSGGKGRRGEGRRGEERGGEGQPSSFPVAVVIKG